MSSKIYIFSEILLEDSINSSETMRREHRRLAGVSWIGTEDSDIPPLKPSRTVNETGNIHRQILVLDYMLIFILNFRYSKHIEYARGKQDCTPDLYYSPKSGCARQINDGESKARHKSCSLHHTRFGI